jgi:predicted CoA-binding protein
MAVVAVIGASHDRRKFGNKAVRAFLNRGYQVVPVNPCYREIEGLVAYASVLDVPFEIDIATLYLPPEVGERVVVEVVAKRIRELWLNPGADGSRVLERARALGLEPSVGCSIIAIGESPIDYE